MERHFLKEPIKLNDYTVIDRKTLFGMIEIETWDYFAPLISGQKTDPDKQHKRWMFRHYEKLGKKVASSDLALTKKYFPEMHYAMLCGYVRHSKSPKTEGC